MTTRFPATCHGILALALSAGLLAGCMKTAELDVQAGMGPDPALPPPVDPLIPTVNIAEAVGWPEHLMPEPAEELAVRPFARDLQHPRWLYVLPNGDVLVAETNAPPRPEQNKGIKGWIMGKVMEEAGAAVPSANRITLLRDANGDGTAEFRSVFLEGLNSPFGMVLVEDRFYVANTDAVLEFSYTEGAERITAPGRELAALPAGPLNQHWTKSLTASPDGNKLYIGVGSNSNVAENGMDKEEGRAAIWEIDRHNGNSRVYASGLRNPVGMTWVNEEELWVSVNERDEMGGDLVPDYMTSVSPGGFYGWPYFYFGRHLDERVAPAPPELAERVLTPDYALGPHTASLGLLYVDESALPSPYNGGMFVGQHGSWNRNPRSGYQVIFVGFANGEPSGMPQPVLTGFVNEAADEAYGRPVGLALTAEGSLLVADDVGNTVWHVSAGNAADDPDLAASQVAQ